jgi:phosphotransferase system  glucose/maltose/N-acetylglucosamine-specific IIC component
MRLNIPAMGLAFGLLWSGCILVSGLANMIWPPYGLAFLQVCASIYPGYQPDAGIGSVIIGTIYGLLDGGFGGAVFAWLYNRFVGNTAA